jgi:hypothetical protein
MALIPLKLESRGHIPPRNERALR